MTYLCVAGAVALPLLLVVGVQILWGEKPNCNRGV